MGEKQEQERLQNQSTIEQEKDQKIELKPPTPEPITLTEADIPFPSFSIASSPHLMVTLKCNSCLGDFQMEKYWYDIWVSKKKVNKKYRGIRCKWCGAYDSIERMGVVK